MIRSISRVLLSLGAVGGMLAARPAVAHPLHTSIAELVEEREGEFTVSLRVFRDDFLRRTGVAENAATAPRPDARILSYLSRTFVLIDRSGRGLPLKWCGSKRVADLLVMCLSGRVSGGLGGTRVRFSVLSDVFPDQVNVLQLGGVRRKQSLLFTPTETTRLIR